MSIAYCVNDIRMGDNGNQEAKIKGLNVERHFYVQQQANNMSIAHRVNDIRMGKNGKQKAKIKGLNVEPLGALFI